MKRCGISVGDIVIASFYRHRSTDIWSKCGFIIVCTYDYTNPYVVQKIREYVSDYLTALGVFSVIIVVGGLLMRFLRINDFYRMQSIFTAAVQILDMLSDSFLAIDIYLQDKIKPANGYNIMFYICVICIVVPALLSLLQVYYFSWNIWFKKNVVREWLIKYSKFLYIISVFTGSSFTAIEIMNSNIFGLSYFEMGLSNKQIVAFKTQRIYSVILLEVKLFISSKYSQIAY